MRSIKKWMASLTIAVLAMSQVTYGQTTNLTSTQFAQSLAKISKTGAVLVKASNEVLTREMAAKEIVHYLGYEAIAKTLETKCSYKDVTTNKGEIELVSRLGLMNGTGEGIFSPQAAVSEEQAQAIIGKIATKLGQSVKWQHACYAISSSSQMADLAKFNAVSFGWAQLEKSGDGFHVVTNDTKSDFKVPGGFTKPLDLAKAQGVETYLMIYFEDKNGQAASFLNDPVARNKVISEIVGYSMNLARDGESRAFDGVTVDFEGFKSSELRGSYCTFLKELKAALAAAGKKMNVAVQPTTYYKGYDYHGIGEVSDHVILMAHDYGTRVLSKSEKEAGMTTTPLTPIDQVYTALYEASTQIADTSKIALQMSFGSIQWQSKGGIVQNATAYTPSYDKIASRLAQPGTKQQFNTYYQSAYATYSDAGIDQVIWYENTKSLQVKMELAKLLGVTGVSYWRLGIIPQDVSLVH